MSEKQHHVFFFIADSDVSEVWKFHVIGGDDDFTSFVELHEGLNLHLHVLFLLLEALHGLVEETHARTAGNVGQAEGFRVCWDYCPV